MSEEKNPNSTILPQNTNLLILEGYRSTMKIVSAEKKKKKTKKSPMKVKTLEIYLFTTCMVILLFGQSILEFLKFTHPYL